MNDVKTELKHHGIRGQRWGKRNGPPYPLKESSKSSAEKSHKSSSQKKGLTDRQKTALKVGAALSVTALAAYGGYKLYQAYGGTGLKDVALKTKVDLPNTQAPKPEPPKTKYMKLTDDEVTEMKKQGLSDDDILQFDNDLVEDEKYQKAVRKIGKWDVYRDKNWENSISSEGKENIKKYTNLAYKYVNEGLRRGSPSAAVPHDEWVRTIKTMDDALDKYKLKQESTFYRFSNDDKFLGGAKTVDEIKKLIGSVVHDDAYISTSTSSKSPGILSFTTGKGVIRYDIKTDAETGIGAFVAGISNNPDENEFLFNRGSDFEVIGVRDDEELGMPVVELLYKGMRRAAIS